MIHILEIKLFQFSCKVSSELNTVILFQGRGGKGNIYVFANGNEGLSGKRNL